MIYETIPSKYLDHSDLARFLYEACALRFVAKRVAEKGVEVLQEGEVTSGGAVNIGGAINVCKNIEDYIDYTMSVFLEEGIVKDVLNDLNKDELSILVDKIMESKTYHDVYNEWMEQIPQLVQKYLKGKVYQVSKVSCRYTECGSVERQL